jgi:hypothetical protein
MSLRKSSGILLVVMGEKYVAEGLPLVASIRRHMPDCPIHIVSDLATDASPLAPDSLDRWDVSSIETGMERRHRGFYLRDLALTRTPFKRTLHIDCDTILGAPCYEIFFALNRFNMAAVPAAPKVHGYGDSSEKLPEDDGLGAVAIVPRVNCGVIAYHKRAVDMGFFDYWLKIYKSGMARATRLANPVYSDQSMFRRAVWETKVDILMMTPEYNFRTGAPQYLDGPVRIAHGRPPNRPAFIDWINSSTDRRLYIPYRALIFRKNGEWTLRPYLCTDRDRDLPSPELAVDGAGHPPAQPSAEGELR